MRTNCQEPFSLVPSVTLRQIIIARNSRKMLTSFHLSSKGCGMRLIFYINSKCIHSGQQEPF